MISSAMATKRRAASTLTALRHLIVLSAIGGSLAILLTAAWILAGLQ